MLRQETMKNPDHEVPRCCSRCRTVIEHPAFLCQNGHLACEKCQKVFCQICRHTFEDKTKEITAGELNLDSSSTSATPTNRINPDDPYKPNDGTIEFGKSFSLPKKGHCRFYAAIDSIHFTFNWKLNPQEGTVEVDVSPSDIVNENWFVVDFACPSDENKKLTKEWAVSHRLIIDYYDVEALYENNYVDCKIHVHRIPYGKVVKPFEDKIKDAFVSVFKSKNQYERL